MFEPVRLCDLSPGKQCVRQRTAGSEHQGSDGCSGRAPRFAHPGSGGGAEETGRGVGCSSGGETGLDGTRGAHGVYPGAAEGNRSALLCAGSSPDSQQVFHFFIIFGVALGLDQTDLRLVVSLFVRFFSHKTGFAHTFVSLDLVPVNCSFRIHVKSDVLICPLQVDHT